MLLNTNEVGLYCKHLVLNVCIKQMWLVRWDSNVMDLLFLRACFRASRFGNLSLSAVRETRPVSLTSCPLRMDWKAALGTWKWMTMSIASTWRPSGTQSRGLTSVSTVPGQEFVARHRWIVDCCAFVCFCVFAPVRPLISFGKYVYYHKEHIRKIE
jgi:hypothetical protein